MQHGILKCQDEKINGSKLSGEFRTKQVQFWKIWESSDCKTSVLRAPPHPRTHREVLLGGLIPIQLNEILGIVLSH